MAKHMDIIARLFEAPGQSFFLFGPRGTGKSTWLKKAFPEATYLDLLDPHTAREFSTHPEKLMEIVDAGIPSEILIIDEIQKIPELLDVVHLLMENNPAVRFILTGSSSRKLKRSGVDLLAGRAILKTMHPFLATELGSSFSLESALKTGMLPLVVRSSDPIKTLHAYLALYIREEVQMESLVRSIGSFGRFLEAATFSHGGVLNTTEIARECMVNRKTVAGYLEVLEDLLLSFQIPVFSRRAKRKLSAHPKFYVFDCGVFRSLRPVGPIDSDQDIDGATLEGLVAQHLRAWLAYRKGDGKLFFWRTRAGVEVDFVLYGEDLFVGIEVKNSQRVSSRMLRGLKNFREDYPEAQTILLYRGKDRLKKEGVLCLPCEEFLKNLHPDHPLPTLP